MSKEDSETQTRLVTWLEELMLLGSIVVARFIVWRELRRERKEKEGFKCRI